MPDLMRASIDGGINVPAANVNTEIDEASVTPHITPFESSYKSDNDSWSQVIGEMEDGSIPSVSEYLRDNPGASYEDVMKFMSQYSDEWAEKLIDYYMSQDSINKANEYNASREDTAYQRLVADLKAAGLNPALMYGNSASPVGTASSGVYDPSGSASSSRISNLKKIKELALAAILAEWQIKYQTTSNDLKGIQIVGGLLMKMLGLSIMGS